MVGRFKVSVPTIKLKYSLELKRKITVLCGNSGIGKTTLVRMIMLSRRKNNPYKVISERPCIGITADSYIEMTDLANFEDSIIFLDDDVDYVSTKEFAEIVKESSCYFVIVTREVLNKLPNEYMDVCVITG